MDWILIIVTATALGTADDVQIVQIGEAQCRGAITAMAPLKDNNLAAACIGPTGQIMEVTEK